MASRAAMWRRPVVAESSCSSPGPVPASPASPASPTSLSSAPSRLVAAAGVTRCGTRELTLSHELTVRGAALTSPPYLSVWFRHPEGDPERWWRMAVRPEDSGGGWTLALQLASTDELGSLYRRRPRCLSPGEAFGVEAAQTSYILKTVDTKLVFNRGYLAPSLGLERFQTHRPTALLNNNFAILGYLDTLQPLSVCDLGTGLLNEVRSSSADDRALCIQVSFTVEFHESDATS